MKNFSSTPPTANKWLCSRATQRAGRRGKEWRSGGVCVLRLSQASAKRTTCADKKVPPEHSPGLGTSLTNVEIPRVGVGRGSPPAHASYRGPPSVRGPASGRARSSGTATVGRGICTVAARTRLERGSHDTIEYRWAEGRPEPFSEPTTRPPAADGRRLTWARPSPGTRVAAGGEGTKPRARAFAAGVASGREQGEIEPLLEAAVQDARKFSHVRPFWLEE
jgi:hypothetical protein